MGVPPEVSSAVMGRLFSIFIYVNILISLPARTHGSTPLQLTSGSAGSAPCFALGLPMQSALELFIMEAGCIRYAIAVIALMLLPDNKGIHLDDLDDSEVDATPALQPSSPQTHV